MTYKFTNGTELTEEQVMQQYDLEDPEDLEIWADDHYNTSLSVANQTDIYNP